MLPPNKWAIIAGVILSLFFFNPSYALSPISENNYCNDNICLKTDDLNPENAKQVLAVVSAYNNLPKQTDSTPNIMASGNRVYIGAIACPSYLPFGTIIEIDNDYYICEDRMHLRYRYGNYFDIFMYNVAEAKEWGRKQLVVTIYEN